MCAKQRCHTGRAEMDTDALARPPVVRRPSPSVALCFPFCSSPPSCLRLRLSLFFPLSSFALLPPLSGCDVIYQSVVLGCSHSYCRDCIESWFKKKKACPVCREVHKGAVSHTTEEQAEHHTHMPRALAAIRRAVEPILATAHSVHTALVIDRRAEGRICASRVAAPRE
jgi:hypothetical protein